MTAPCPGCHTPGAASVPQEAVGHQLVAEARLTLGALAWAVEEGDTDTVDDARYEVAGLASALTDGLERALADLDSATNARWQAEEHAARADILADLLADIREHAARYGRRSAPWEYIYARTGEVSDVIERARDRARRYRDATHPNETIALRSALDSARATIARLNARAQVAEAALHELTTTTGKGKAHRVAREVWQRCEESHGLVCPTTRRARDFAARVEAENARLISDVAAGEASDGHHTHRELYAYRMAFHAHAASGWLAAGIPVVKSWRHSDGEMCFGGGWFIVSAELPTGQVTNHYSAEHWGLFAVPDVELAPEYDGHTPEVALDRALRALLADTDGTRSVAQCMACGRDVFAGDALCCPAEGEGAE